ncbi:MAG: hypothetical protein AAFN10_11470 [Bacteroidota bacterium]
MSGGKQSKILFEGRGWKFKLDPFAHAAVAKLLGNTIWGTKGGIRYSHTEGLRKVQELTNSSYITLWREDEIRACVGFVQKPLCLKDQTLPAYYIRYLAVAASWQSQTQAGVVRQAKETQKAGNRLFRKKLAQVFTDQAYWRYEGRDTQAACFYAYVVMDNDRSANLVLSNGFRALRSFRTMVFSRFKPKRSPKVRKIKASEKAKIEAQLQSFYQDYSYPKEDLRIQHDYYVWEEQGEMIAGVQAQPIKWRIEEIPGLVGRLAMRFLPKIGFLRRILNPEDFRFVGLDALYYRDKAKHILPQLYEHVLADQGLYVSMIWLDDQTDLYRDYLSIPKGEKGFLSRVVQGNGAAKVFFRSDEEHLGAGLAERLSTMPHYIAVGDVS